MLLFSFFRETIAGKQKTRLAPGSFGAVEKTRTSTGCPTATSTLRVYQFRHDRIVVGRFVAGEGASSKGISAAQVCRDSFLKDKISTGIPV
jgi:hypothetical protein